MAPTKRFESTLVGLKYPSERDSVIKTGAKWLKDKRQDDGAEGLWRVDDKLYDLSEFAKSHPGGTEWITLTRGTDITEAFEAHHVRSTAELMLPKFFVRNAIAPRASPFTFKPDGFYRKFKARAREALKDVDFHKSSRTSNLIADSLFVGTIALSVIAATTRSWIAIVGSGVLLTWTAITGHNFMHQRDSFRMYYMDLLLLSSREWRINHALSHHLFTNTVQDMEITAFEPFLSWLPRPDKGPFTRFVSWIISPPVYTLMIFEEGLKRIYSTFWEWNGPGVRDAVPFLIPAAMCVVAPPAVALWTWMKVIAVASFHFTAVGVSAAHHHPDIFHDGDVHREDMDWGLAELDAVRDRAEIDTSIFLVLTSFGSHSLHHLLPSVDHAYLYLCEPAFAETCKEFGISTELWSQWDHVKGQFLQLVNNAPKKTANTR
ncbi:cytochrome b5-related protein [Neodiprion lecontei]|uniref:Cytochrome b5-related protein n=1 Tax=Neodiprion lecontei TaxID=441921 RepID=A0A6J0BFM1_NEOLC|nr:cytochrome b5-related protein [Neodiprion lecontei]XP_015512972.1 cytochrome b5-related protein [Neodiprion lecontei]XP_015512975.1 cytochrome b5-related protein [Neodiprion lecontei]